MTKFFQFLVLIFFLHFSASIIASDSKQWLMQEIKVEDGLPDSTVFSIQQDQSGFMWFGTTNGLARFDGYSFKVLKHDGADLQTISNNNAGNIFIDSNNLMWVGTFGGGVNTLNISDGKITRYPYTSSKYSEVLSENVQTFYEDKDSNIWIGTANGLYRLDGENLEYYSHNTNKKNSLIHSRIWDITSDSNNDLWIGTSNGLSHLNPENGKINNYQLPENLIVDISSNQFRKLLIIGDKLFLGSSTGLYSFDKETKKFTTHTPIHNMKINDLHILDGEYLLIASMEGLFQFDIAQNEFKKDQTGQYWRELKHVDIRNIYFDKLGLIWLATRDNGVIKVDQQGGLFQHHASFLSGENQNELNKQVFSLEYDAFENLYLGTSDTLFKRSKKNTFERIIVENHHEVPGIIRDTKVSQNNGLWIAGSQGLFYLEPSSTQAQIINEPFELVGIKPTDVFSVEQTSDGEIWLALYNNGILRWKPDSSEAELIQSYSGGTLTDINLVHIYEDSHGHLWLGSYLAGLFRIDQNTKEIKPYTHDFNNINSLSSNRVKDIFEDSQDRLWFSTFRGLNLFNPKDDSFKHYMTSDGLLDHSINAILEDSKQNLWLVSKFGLILFNPEKNIYENFTLPSEIRHDGFYIRSAVIDSQDKLYIGSANGFYSFDPNDINNSIDLKPSLQITDVRINNVPKSFKQIVGNKLEFDLKPDDTSISFVFASLDYKSANQIHYLYRISGLYENWLDITSTRKLELNNLNPGAYDIDIKVTNNDGRWSEQQLQIHLNVHPEWWNIGWVRLLFVLFGIFLALFFHSYRTIKIKKYNRHLEDKVAKRTSELENLNSQLKKASRTDFLTGIYNRSGFLKAFKKTITEPHHYCIVVSDLDNFKIINDVYGHAAGDLVLVEVTKLMQSMLPEGDFMARWGGEEFIFYLGNKSDKQAFQIIEKMRLLIANQSLVFKNKTIQVTCTFGICQNSSTIGLKKCINFADQTLYLGKNSGRNQTNISNQDKTD
ncbi:MAG: two-component regulator propeller domain-containing protein [Marinicellaceae bacterium]